MTPPSEGRLTELLNAQLSTANDVIADSSKLKDWKAQTGVLLRAAVGDDNDLVQKFEAVSYAYTGPRYSGMVAPDQNAYRRNGVESAVALIKAAITNIELRGIASSSTAQGGDPLARTRIFIVHGHDEALKESVARFLLQLTGDEPVILHEQLNAGATIIEKLERLAATAAYAVVLATADDYGRAAATPDELPRARQNVVFELGYFFAALGRSRVALLYESGVERPSDTDGILHIAVDPGGAWKVKLTSEIEGAGFAVDRTALR
ncbi:TIR domain-containing protein [Mycobacterium paraintracellulare]|uniref:TIR domain-containing protein n=1 Tax=Mycobacterium paraintracellulare TaxID=1138383 RepID=UPI0019255940|nr:nucleotide-binding protein [Mycobacterium paraintracellulare]